MEWLVEGLWPSTFPRRKATAYVLVSAGGTWSGRVQCGQAPSPIVSV